MVKFNEEMSCQTTRHRRKIAKPKLLAQVKIKISNYSFVFRKGRKDSLMSHS